MKYIKIIALLLLPVANVFAQAAGFGSGTTNVKLDDSIVEQRMSVLSAETGMPMVWNDHVESFLDLYVKRFNEKADAMLQRTYLYFPAIEDVLRAFGLPDGLKYLPLAESTYKPTAVSRQRCLGLWQMKPETGISYGLDTSSYVNEFFDLVLETEAACKQLKELYDYYGDWLLTIAAFNTGMANVNKAIMRAGSKDYWEVCQYLPKKVKGYVPAYIAITYMMRYPEDYGLHPMCSVDAWHETETIFVRDTLTFEAIQNVTGVSIEELETFNPQYVKDVVPGSLDHPCVVRLRRKCINNSLLNK